VHLVAGAFTLGVLIHLGPRIGRFNADGSANDLRPHNLPMTMLGLMLIFVGFFGFMMGCVIYSPEGYTTVFGTPTNLSAFVFNMLMGLAGGLLGAYMSSRGEPFWTVSGGLAGVIAVASGIDLYSPPMAFIIANVGGVMIPYGGKLLKRFRIDDAAGAVAVHAMVGIWSLLACGIFLAGYPSAVGGPDISLLGQLGSIAVLRRPRVRTRLPVRRRAEGHRSPAQPARGRDARPGPLRDPGRAVSRGQPGHGRVAALRSPERRRRGAHRHLQRTGGMTT
jgi:ammonium transporter, Amt family